MFESDDFDWALGELLVLFDRANRCGVYPHVLEPRLFFDAWGLLGEQPFDVREHWRRVLMAKITRPLRLAPNAVPPQKRYVYFVQR